MQFTGSIHTLFTRSKSPILANIGGTLRLIVGWRLNAQEGSGSSHHLPSMHICYTHAQTMLRVHLDDAYGAHMRCTSPILAKFSQIWAVSDVNLHTDAAVCTKAMGMLA